MEKDQTKPKALRLPNVAFNCYCKNLRISSKVALNKSHIKIYYAYRSWLDDTKSFVTYFIFMIYELMSSSLTVLMIILTLELFVIHFCYNFYEISQNDLFKYIPVILILKKKKKDKYRN